MDILDKIISAKRGRGKKEENCKSGTGSGESCFLKWKMPSFHQSLLKPFPSIIGEFKRKSPSRGDIFSGAAIQKVVMGYQDRSMPYPFLLS